jgi:hypothetical protein
MAYPPLEPEPENTVPSSSHNPTITTTASATLTITDTLAAGDGRGAQLVVCSIASPKKALEEGTGSPQPQAPFEAVAKIFDALYYPFENPEVGHVPTNPAKRADIDYTREAAALGHLCNSRRMGLAAPGYLGAWTFGLPITCGGEEEERAVRLVLMEYVRGPSIWSICRDPAALSRYSEQDRLEILAGVLDGVVRQRHAGVDQGDLASRNVVLRPCPSSSSSSAEEEAEAACNGQPLPQPVLVDYNTAVVYELTRFGKCEFQLREFPENPMELFWDWSFPEFADWTPPGWNNNVQQRQEWLKERFGGENASHYAPVSAEPDFTEA